MIKHDFGVIHGGPLKELKDYFFLFKGTFKGTFSGNFGHWRPLEALGLSTSYWFGR